MHVVDGREVEAKRRGVSLWRLSPRRCASMRLWRSLAVAISWASTLAAPSWPQESDTDGVRSGSSALASLSHPEANLFVGGVSTDDSQPEMKRRAGQDLPSVLPQDARAAHAWCAKEGGES